MAMLSAESLAAKLRERPTKEEDEAGAKASAETARAATRAKAVFILVATFATGGGAKMSWWAFGVGIVRQ